MKSVSQSTVSVQFTSDIPVSFCIHCLKFTVSSVPKLFSSKRFNKCFSTSFKCEQLSQECNIQFRLLVLHTYFNKNCLQSVLPGIAEYNNFAFWCISHTQTECTPEELSTVTHHLRRSWKNLEKPVLWYVVFKNSKWSSLRLVSNNVSIYDGILHHQ